MSEELKAAQARIACLEGEIAKRDEELAACRVAVENCDLFRARIAEIEADRDSHQRCAIQAMAELAAIKAQEPVAIEFRQFMTSVVTGAGLLSCGKQSKGLAAELSATAYKYLLGEPVYEAKAQGVIDFVFSGELPNATFVEVEDGNGNSINVGEWFKRDDGYSVLRLNAAPVQQDQAFCEYCGGNDEEPQDHCMDCTRPVQQVSVPDGWRELAKRADDFLYSLPETDSVLRLRADLCTMLAAPAAPAADAGLVEALEASNMLLRTKRHACENEQVCHVLDVHIKRNTEALAAHRAQGLV